MLSEHELAITPATYYAAKTGAPSQRACRDEALKSVIDRVHRENYGVYGVRKRHAALRRGGRPDRARWSASPGPDARRPGRARASADRSGPGRSAPAVLELRHRQRARAEDRNRALKDSGLRNLPLHRFAPNQIWLELVLLGADLLAWTQHLALAGQARRWEPKRLRHRLFAVAGRLVRTGRRTRLRLATNWPWTRHVVDGITALHALPQP